MPKNNRPQTHSDAADASVKLKPFLGIRPGVYLTAIYGVALALIVFFLLFFPGIKNPGAYLTVSVRPGSASVKVDGVFAGTAPGTIFVRNGTRSVEISKPFYKSAVSQVTVRGRVFATLFVRSRKWLSVELGTEDVGGLVRHAVEDYAANPHIPQLISDAAWAAYGFRGDSQAAAGQEKLYGLVATAAYFTTGENQLRELLAAASRTASYGGFLTPQGLVSIVQKAAAFASVHENAPAWLLLSLSRDHARSVSSAPWVAKHFGAYRESLSRYFSGGPGAATGGSVSMLAGLRFRSVPAGVAIIGKDDNLDALGKSIDALLPHPVAIRTFLLSETEVTNRQYRAFLEENPQWKPSARSSLVEKGLVTETYLADWKADAYPTGQDELPVSSVSFNAAVAFCEWLGRRVQSSVPGATVRLPTEAEWEWAARGGLRGMPYPLGERPGKSVLFTKGIAGPSPAGASEPNGYGLRDMVGNVWEWCSDTFGPSDYLLSSLDPARNADGPHQGVGDRVVRGGGWNSQRELLRLYTRGSQPAEWCTPYLGFRVAVARQ